MYNRYLRSDDGVYTRIPMQDAHEPSNASPPPGHEAPPHQEAHSPGGEHRGRSPFSDEPFLGRILGKLNLKDIDTADLLLLLILFFLFEEKADDELLVALGRLLIL